MTFRSLHKEMSGKRACNQKFLPAWGQPVARGDTGKGAMSAHLVVVDHGQGAAGEAHPVGRQLLQPDGGGHADRVAIVLPDLRAETPRFYERV